MARTQVAIIGGGPSGLLLSQLLERQGIASVVLAQRSRDYVESRIRAGMLEPQTVELLVGAGVGERLMREGLPHDGFEVAFADRVHRFDLQALVARAMMVYGQTEIQRDLGDAREAAGGDVRHEVEDIAIEGIDGARPSVSFTHRGRRTTLDCDFVAGCDGFHGASRRVIPASVLKTYERVYPFGWLGIMADVPPIGDEIIYANHARGFALCSMRSKTRSRYYVQCSLEDRVEEWPDQRFWDELCSRLPQSHVTRVTTGPSIEKSIAPLRSFVVEPMSFGRLFLVGDAAHIVPPSGAKGLNLAVADVRVLARALVEFYRQGSATLLGEYSARALARVWKATRFSWWFTSLMHKFDDDPFTHRLQLT